MQLKVRIGWQDYLVQMEDFPTLATLFTRITDDKGEMIPLSMSQAPDMAREKMREELKKELGDETDKFRNYWLEERNKTARLEKELKEARDATTAF